MALSLDEIVAKYSVTEIAETLEPTEAAHPEILKPRYNIAPTQLVPVIVPQAIGGKRVLDDFRWGLVPFWAKDPAIGNKMINARGETVAEKPAFRDAFRRRRCVIPASGFYEWDKLGGSKQPYYFLPTTDDSAAPLFGFAGLWETWRPSRDAEPLHTCTIVTTAANQTVGAVHDRMPVILDTDAVDLWLDPTVTDSDLLRQLLQPYPDNRMQAIAVSKRVNSVVNDDNGLIEPVVNSA